MNYTWGDRVLFENAQELLVNVYFKTLGQLLKNFFKKGITDMLRKWNCIKFSIQTTKV